MKVEIPKFKRCCFCIPLRYGLLVWGYIKLVTSLITFLFGSLIVQTYLQFYFMVGAAIIPIVLLGLVLLLCLMVDIGMTIVFLISGHRKSAKLMRIFYIYSIVFLCVTAAFFTISTIYDLSVGDKYNSRYRSSYRHREVMSYGALVTTKAVTAFTFSGIQAYIVLLIRSEVNKLQNSRNFMFTNNAAEAECTMENTNNEPGLLTHNLNTEDYEVGKDPNNFKGTYDYNKF